MDHIFLMEKAGVVVYCDMWSAEADNALKELVAIHGTKHEWTTIAKGMPIDVSGKACRHRWSYFLGCGVKGHWNDEEDRVIILAVSQGMNKWSEIAKLIPGRVGKQCRERWFNHLSPELKKTPWTSEEDDLLIAAQAKLGNSWSKVTLEIPGRSENEVKNRWYSAVIRRKLCNSFYALPSSEEVKDVQSGGLKRHATDDIDGNERFQGIGAQHSSYSTSTATAATAATVAAGKITSSIVQQQLPLKRVRYTLTEDDLISLHIAELYLQGIQLGHMGCASSDSPGMRQTLSRGPIPIGKTPSFRRDRYLVPEDQDKNSIGSMDTIQKDFQKYCTRFQEGITNCSGVMDSISGLTTPYSLSVSCSPLWAGLISAPASPK